MKTDRAEGRATPRRLVALVLVALVSGMIPIPVAGAKPGAGGGNSKPTVANSTTSTNEDTAVSITLSATDAKQQSLTFNLKSSPSNASVTGLPQTVSSSSNPAACQISGSDQTCSISVTYTPNANYNGSDSFTWEACDDAGACSSATVSITVATVNDVPSCANRSLTLNEGDGGTVAPSCADADGDSLTYSVGTASYGSTAVNASNELTYAHNGSETTSDSFTYKACDSNACSSNATVSVTVTPVNDAPVANDDSASANEDTASSSFNVLTNDTDAENQALSIHSYDSSSAQGGSVSCTTSTGACTYTPPADFNGTDTFTYKATDGSVQSNSATVTIAVDSENDSPTCSNRTLTVDEGGSGTVSPSCSDPDSSTLTYEIVDAATNGTASVNSSGDLAYSHNGSEMTSDSFTYEGCDSENACAAKAMVSVTVTAVNDAPVANDDSKATSEDTATSINVLSNDSDVDSSDLDISSVDSTGTRGSVACDNETGACTYTPAANFNGTDTFTYKATDGSVESNSATVTVTVDGVNDAPTCSDDSATTNEDTAFSASVTCSDVDSGDTLAYSVVDGPSNGSLGSSFDFSDGSFTYSPAADYNGSDSFTFKATDGTVHSSTKTFSITVTAFNDPPSATDDSATTAEDTAVTTDVLANDDDVDHDSLTITGSTDGANGTVSCDDGTLGCTYTPAANFSGSDSYTYTISDGNGGSDTASVAIGVTASSTDGGGGGGGGGGTAPPPTGADPTPTPTSEPTPVTTAEPSPSDVVPPAVVAQADASLISPNGDARLDEMTVTATFSEPTAWMFVIVSDAAAMSIGDPVFSVSGEGETMTITWTGAANGGSLASDGTYEWKITGHDAAGNEMESVLGTVTVDTSAPVFTGLKVTRDPFMLKRHKATRIKFGVNEPSMVKVKIRRHGRLVRSFPWMSVPDAEELAFKWNGRNKNGRLVKKGRYRVVVKAVDLGENKTVNKGLRIRVRR